MSMAKTGTWEPCGHVDAQEEHMTFMLEKSQYIYIYMYIYIYIYTHIWVNYNSLTARPNLESWLVREIIPFYGRTIQVSEILLFTSISIYIYILYHIIYMIYDI